MAEREIRIGTLNVHSWADGEWKSSVTRVGQLLGEENLDIVLLQESKGSKKKRRQKKGLTSESIVEEISLRLRIPHFICSGEMAILSRYPITRVGLLDRDGSARVSSQPESLDLAFSSSTFGRMLSVVVDLDGSRYLRVINIHLNYQKEPTRAREIKKILQAVPPKGPTVLAGDFNALTRRDYSKKEWEEIADIRRKNAWEAPVSRLMDELRQGGWVDSRQSVPDNGRSGSNSTCRFGTRVDYVLLNESAHRSIHVTESRHVQTDSSDHALVVVRLQIKTK